MFHDVMIENIGAGHSPVAGGVGEQLMQCRFDPGLMRPYINENGVKCCTVNTGRIVTNEKTGRREPEFEEVSVKDLMDSGIYNPVFNAVTGLRKDEWIELDNVVIRAARQRLRAFGDLAAANTFGGFNGMAKTVLEHETMSDPGQAVVDMDGLTPGPTDSPQFQLEGLPLPITHSDFWFSSRRLATSRNSGTPLDTSMGEAAGRRVAETIEQTTIGTTTGLIYGDGSGIYGRTNLSSGTAPQVYGYTNFPDRNVITGLTAPTGANGTDILGEWLNIRDALYNDRFYGPYMVYTSANWDEFLDNLFSTAEPSAGTLRSRLLEIEDIQDIRRLDFLDSAAFQVIFVQMTPDVARAVDGMGITTVQWETMGGMRVNFKVMAIQVPQLRADFNGRCGIAHATS